MPNLSERPKWDDEKARGFLGKRVIIGLTYVTREGEFLGQSQVRGQVVQVDAGRGVAIELGNSAEIFWLPPDTDAVNEAPPGEYRFRSTGELVVDPDLMTSWTVT